MRRATLLTLVLVAFLAAPSVAAAPAPVNVVDFAFQPQTVSISPGGSVRWAFNDQTHTVTADRDQTISFDSKEKSPGATYTHAFAKRGSFTYHCKIHPFMHGRVKVGPAPFPDTRLPRVKKLKPKVSGSKATLRFKLSEKSTVRVKLTGADTRRVKRTLRKGRRRIVLRNLDPGRYKATLRATDKAHNKGRRVVQRFRIAS